MGESGSGPYLACATVCEKILQERDGVLSLVRVVDRFTITGPSPSMPEITMAITMLVKLVSGGARGKHAVTLRIEDPAGQQAQPEVRVNVLFEGEDRSVQVNVQLALRASLEGLYWIDVLLGTQRITRVPVRILYQQVAPGQQLSTPR